jgi:hypothetical protein
MRAALSNGLGNPGGLARLSATALDARARLELLNAISAGLSLSSSAVDGAAKRLVVYLAE